MSAITSQQLISIVDFDPFTGLFQSRKNRKWAPKGFAGNFDKSRGYIRLRIKRKLYSAHRLAWLYFYCHYPKNQIDHINGIRTDNRIENLRDVTHQENHRNEKLRSTNKSGRVGVFLCKERSKWLASITVDGKQISLGYFKELEDAIASREKAEEKYMFHINHGRLR